MCCMNYYYGGSIYCMPLMVIELYSLPVVNKKGTKFVSARKTIPNVNLRGKYVEPYQTFAHDHCLTV